MRPQPLIRVTQPCVHHQLRLSVSLFARCTSGRAQRSAAFLSVSDVLGTLALGTPLYLSQYTLCQSSMIHS
jgi:hypothetical protein